MAIACLRLVTRLPLRPLLSVPRLRRRIADFTDLFPPLLYRAISWPLVVATRCAGVDPWVACARCAWLRTPARQSQDVPRLDCAWLRTPDRPPQDVPGLDGPGSARPIDRRRTCP